MSDERHEAATDAPREVPASWIQRRLWFLDRLGAGAAFHVPMAFRLRGPLDVGVLERSLREVVRRHAVLRTALVDVDGRPVQRVASEVEVRLVPEPFAGGVDAASTESLAEAARPLPLDRAPLFRARLLHLGPDDHALLLTVHHAVWDRGSTGILFRELAATYPAFRRGEPSPLPELPSTYLAFAARQAATAGDPATHRALERWRERLAGLEPLELPRDRPRPAASGYASGVHDTALDVELVDRLRALARRERTSLAAVLLAASAATLARTAGALDLAFGVPASHRTRPELEPLLGPFLNTVVVRLALDGDPAFASELLPRAHAALFDALEDQTVAFEELVDVLAPRRDASRHPLYQVAFSKLDVRREVLHLDEVEVSPLGRSAGGPESVDPRTLRTPVDLELRFLEHAGGLVARLVHDADLFDSDRIERLARGLCSLLEDVAARPDARLSELRVLDDAATRAAVPDPEPWCPGAPLHERLAERFAATPDAVAVVEHERGRSTTYAELDARAAALAVELRAAGVAPGDAVGLLLERSAGSVAALLACLEVGVAFVPLAPAWPAARLADAVRGARVTVVVACTETAARAPAGTRVVVLASEGAAPADPRRPRPRSEADALAFVLFTSGSTGLPKGVEGRLGSIEHRVSWELGAAPLGAADAVAHRTSLGFVDSIYEVLATLVGGARLVVLSEATVHDAGALVEALATHGVTRLLGVPTSLADLLTRADATVLPRLACVNLTGEPLPLELVRRFRARFPRARLRNLYGSTEVLDATEWDLVPDAPIPERVTVGRPLPGVEVLVLDRWARPTDVGVPGEVWVGGAGVALGYRGEDVDADGFVHDPLARDHTGGGAARWFRTGDRARRLASGELVLEGRLDDRTKLHGVRVEPRELEAVLERDPRVVRAVALVDPSERLVAFVQASPEETHGGLAAALREEVRRVLPTTLWPSATVVLDVLPTTASGKPDRAALLARVPAAVGDDVPPRTPLEELVASIWREVLDVPHVGAHDDFFALGGHSLAAARVVARLRTACAGEVALADVFRHPTVAELAAILREGTARDEVPAVPTDDEELAPLTFAQEQLWLLDRMGGGSALALQLAFRLDGALDEDALAGALTDLVRRHAGLRSTFSFADGRPRQRVRESADVQLERTDLTGLDPHELDPHARDAATMRLARDDADRSFDLAQGPPLRARLVLLGRDAHVLLVTVHHVVCDDWSLGVMERELFDAYVRRTTGTGEPPAPLATRLVDLARNEHARHGPAVAEGLLHGWRERLGDVEPLDLARPGRGPTSGTRVHGEHRFDLAPALADEVERLARARRVSPAMVLLASWQVVLARLADRTEVVVGLASAGRDRDELEGLVGPLVHVLPVRVDLADDPRFGDELLPRVRAACLDAWSLSTLPPEELGRAASGASDVVGRPFPDVAFTHLDAPRAALAVEGLAVRRFAASPSRTPLDLELRVASHGPGASARLLFDGTRFDAAEVADLAARFLRVLEHLLRAPETRVGAVPLLSPEERRDALAAACGPQRDFDLGRPWIERVREHVLATPERTAVRSSGRTLSYGRLGALADTIARSLVEAGVAPGDRVPVALPRSLELVVAVLAVQRAGAVCVPLEPEDPPSRTAAKLADLAPRLVLTGADGGAHLPVDARTFVVDLEAESPPLGACAMDVDSRANRHPWRRLLVDGPAPTEVAQVYFTSGSTGRPKAVELHHRGLANVLHALEEEVPSGPDDVWLALGPPAFDISFLELWLPLVAGARVELLPPAAAADPRALAHAFAESGATRAIATPSTWRLLVDAGWRAPRPVRILAGGEALPEELARALVADPNVILHDAYGPTETSVCATIEQVDEASLAAGVTIGRPLANVTVHVLDRFGEPLPVGRAGELWVGGVGVSLGYVGRPDETRERFVPDPFAERSGARLYRTGDRALRLADGRLVHLGRVDRQVQLRGRRIEPGEVEAVLAAHDGVREAAVTVARLGAHEALVAFVVAPGVEPSSVLEHARDRLPTALVPARIVQLERLPVTPRGKLDRAALDARLGTDPGRAVDPPRGQLEELVARRWSETLGCGPVGRHDRFLDLGGHSLAAVTVVDRLERELGVRLDPVDLLFADLAEVARRCRREVQRPRPWYRRLLGLE